MPRVVGYTPPWLSRPSPGFDFFSQTNPLAETKSKGQTHGTGPLRTTALRGTEIFHVVGNELRWTDLSLFKSQWERESGNHGEDTNGADLGSVPSRVSLQLVLSLDDSMLIP